MTPAPNPQPRPLAPRRLPLSGSEYRSIQGWQFPDEPFYVRQVRRMLLRDIPHLVLFEDCLVWGYTDPEAGRDLVGFGTINITRLYSRYTDGLSHSYIPLLSVKPGVTSYGYGQSIVEHLLAEAAVLVSRPEPGTISDRLFLDVYTANDRAVRLYHRKCSFDILNPDTPIQDPDENNEPYIIMARNVALPPAESATLLPSG